MPSKYWIKLYQEILHDPKMGMLPDNLWRRTIELFLLAGELSSDSDQERGVLPATKEMAWLLRQSPATLEQELTELAEVGILTRLESGWLVTNFAKRQAEIQPAERMKKYRERQRKQRFTEVEALEELPQEGVNSGTEIDIRSVTNDVTQRNADIESDIESDELLSNDNNATEAAPLPIEPIPKKAEDERPPPPPPPKESTGYTPTQRNVLALFGAKRFKANVMAETITELTDKYGHDKVIEAARWAAKKGMTLGDAIISLESALPAWGKSKPTKNGANYGTYQRNSGRNDPTGQQLKTEPAYDKHTNELVYPDGTRVPAG